MAAAEYGGHVLNALMDAGATPAVDATDQTGRTALHLAAIAGNTDEVAVLLYWSTESVTAQDERGETALHYGAYYGHIAVCEVILQWCASNNVHMPAVLDARDHDGITPIHWAAREVCDDCAVPTHLCH